MTRPETTEPKQAPEPLRGRIYRPRPLPHFNPDPQDFRDYISETLGVVILHAEIGQRFANMADDAGLEYSLAGAIGALRCARDVFRDMHPVPPADDVEGSR